ncbi:MAG: hypothetical protein HY675_01330 [Chloroflexi bacterium]|nr:hypothetical protein [Chloroflexota bacterium]
MTDRLISRLESVEATGYEHYPAALSMSGEFRLWHPRVRKPLKKIPRFDYFVITGRADGPWVWVTRKADTCPACGQVRALSPDRETFDAMQAERAGDVPRTPILVYPDTWNGEDFFYLSEPGPPIITERIANILDQTGNLRKRTVSGSERESICRTTPKVAARMERLNWEVAVCCELGPAGWVE